MNLVVLPAADLLGGAAAIPGWGSMPPRLVKKALELLPESWSLEPVEGSCCNQRGLVTSSPYWAVCYASLVVILAAQYPEKMPQFMAYLRIIARASRNFESTAWVLYDMVANQCSMDW